MIVNRDNVASTCFFFFQSNRMKNKQQETKENDGLRLTNVVSWNLWRINLNAFAVYKLPTLAILLNFLGYPHTEHILSSGLYQCRHDLDHFCWSWYCPQCLHAAFVSRARGSISFIVFVVCCYVNVLSSFGIFQYLLNIRIPMCEYS